MRHIVSLARNAALLAVLCGVAAVGQQSAGYLKTNVNPGRAGVFIDGKYVGPAANFRIGRKYAVAAGEHEVRLSEPRYEDVVKTVKIEPPPTRSKGIVVKDVAELISVLQQKGLV